MTFEPLLPVGETGAGPSAPELGRSSCLLLSDGFDSCPCLHASNQTSISLSLVDFQIIRLVSEADLVFSPRGRTPVLWGLITRRDWPSTSPSKAQCSPPPALPFQCRTSSTDFWARPPSHPLPPAGHSGVSTPGLAGSSINLHPFFPFSFFSPITLGCVFGKRWP